MEIFRILTSLEPYLVFLSDFNKRSSLAIVEDQANVGIIIKNFFF